jgi:uncharacterized coiled-coil protein SlyX
VVARLDYPLDKRAGESFLHHIDNHWMDAKDRRIRELEDKVAVYEQQMNKINSDLIVLEQAMTNISKEKTKREVELAKKVD